MTRCLLDTDILSEIIKGKHSAVLSRASAYVAQHGRLTTSSVSVAEIIYGFERMGRLDRIVQFEAGKLSESRRRGARFPRRTDMNTIRMLVRRGTAACQPASFAPAHSGTSHSRIGIHPSGTQSDEVKYQQSIGTAGLMPHDSVG